MSNPIYLNRHNRTTRNSGVSRVMAVVMLFTIMGSTVALATSSQTSSRARLGGTGDGFSAGGTASVGSKVTWVGGLLTPCSIETDIDTNFMYDTCGFRSQGQIYSDSKLSTVGTVESDASGAAAIAFWAAGAQGGYFQSTTTFRTLASVADASNAVAGSSDNTVTLVTLGAKLWSFKNNTVEKAYIGLGGEFVSTSTKTRGQITLSAGTGTATILAGAICVCTDTTANVSVKCAVASTTLTATGTTTDVISYICL